jgi:hypothetical protein
MKILVAEDDPETADYVRQGFAQSVKDGATRTSTPERRGSTPTGA